MRAKRVQQTAEEEEELYPTRTKVLVKQHDERPWHKYQHYQKVGYLLKEIVPEQAKKPEQKNAQIGCMILVW